MPTSDTPGLQWMPWEEFDRLALQVVKDILMFRGEAPHPDLRGRAKVLFGHDADNVLGALREPPRICPVCSNLHHGWEARCYNCEKAAEAAEHEAAIRADERAKVEAEVRAELAQKGHG